MPFGTTLTCDDGTASTHSNFASCCTTSQTDCCAEELLVQSNTHRSHQPESHRLESRANSVPGATIKTVSFGQLPEVTSSLMLQSRSGSIEEDAVSASTPLSLLTEPPPPSPDNENVPSSSPALSGNVVFVPLPRPPEQEEAPSPPEPETRSQQPEPELAKALSLEGAAIGEVGCEDTETLNNSSERPSALNRFPTVTLHEDFAKEPATTVPLAELRPHIVVNTYTCERCGVLFCGFMEDGRLTECSQEEMLTRTAAATLSSVEESNATETDRWGSVKATSKTDVSHQGAVRFDHCNTSPSPDTKSPSPHHDTPLSHNDGHSDSAGSAPLSSLHNCWNFTDTLSSVMTESYRLLASSNISSCQPLLLQYINRCENLWADETASSPPNSDIASLSEPSYETDPTASRRESVSSGTAGLSHSSARIVYKSPVDLDVLYSRSLLSLYKDKIFQEIVHLLRGLRDTFRTIGQHYGWEEIRSKNPNIKCFIREEPPSELHKQTSYSIRYRTVLHLDIASLINVFGSPELSPLWDEMVESVNVLFRFSGLHHVNHLVHNLKVPFLSKREWLIEYAVDASAENGLITYQARSVKESHPLYEMFKEADRLSKDDAKIAARQRAADHADKQHPVHRPTTAAQTEKLDIGLYPPKGYVTNPKHVSGVLVKCGGVYETVRPGVVYHDAFVNADIRLPIPVWLLKYISQEAGCRALTSAMQIAHDTKPGTALMEHLSFRDPFLTPVRMVTSQHLEAIQKDPRLAYLRNCHDSIEPPAAGPLKQRPPTLGQMSWLRATSFARFWSGRFGQASERHEDMRAAGAGKTHDTDSDESETKTTTWNPLQSSPENASRQASDSEAEDKRISPSLCQQAEPPAAVRPHARGYVPRLSSCASSVRPGSPSPLYDVHQWSKDLPLRVSFSLLDHLEKSHDFAHLAQLEEMGRYRYAVATTQQQTPEAPNSHVAVESDDTASRQPAASPADPATAVATDAAQEDRPTLFGSGHSADKYILPRPKNVEFRYVFPLYPQFPAPVCKASRRSFSEFLGRRFSNLGQATNEPQPRRGGTPVTPESDRCGPAASPALSAPSPARVTTPLMAASALRTYDSSSCQPTNAESPTDAIRNTAEASLVQCYMTSDGVGVDDWQGDKGT